jgi:glycosyltransferase involved in cell wall biosynthesis
VFHPELHRGGAQQVTYELFKALKARPDVEAYFLAGSDHQQRAFYKSGARITGFDGRQNEFLYLTEGYDHWWHKVSNPLLPAAFAEFLETVRPDIVHFHHFMLLGLDLITLTRRVLPQARIVFTFHEFLAICAADGQMLRTFDKSLCDEASPARCHQCIPGRVPEQFFLRAMWVKRHLSYVDAFTTPSRFMINLYTKWGIPPDQITHVANGQPDYSRGVTPYEPRRKRNRFGFFGQLVDNKGVWVILEAVQYLRSEGFVDFSIEINGDNLGYASEERRSEIEAFKAAEEARPIDQRLVSFNGSYHTDQLHHRMARVDWCIVPSIWWESFGLVLSEAWMFRRPVIASNVGGLAERIQHEVDGLLFNVGDSRSLSAAIRRGSTERRLWDRLRRGIRVPVDSHVMAEQYHRVYTSSSPTEAS